jgi:putative endonuclease
MDECYWVYILHCENNSYYTGYTNDMKKRYLSRVNGTGKCKYTRSFKPLGIAQCWKIAGSKTLALQLERYIKQLPRSMKEKMIARPSMLSTDERVRAVSNKKRFTSP